MNENQIVKFLNVSFYNSDYTNFLHSFRDGVLFTCNVDHLIQLQSNADFYYAYKNAEFVVVDSQILFLLLKILQKPVKSKIAGADFFLDFCKRRKNDKNISLFLFGGYDDTAEIVKKKINEFTHADFVVGFYPTSKGFLLSNEINENVIEAINKSGATVLAVALGAPQQEIWIYKNREKLPKIKIFFALGGTFDVIAGRKKRAPAFLQKIGLEWLFRLLQEPQRLYKRYLIRDLKIFSYFIQEFIGKYKNPFYDEESIGESETRKTS